MPVRVETMLLDTSKQAKPVSASPLALYPIFGIFCLGILVASLFLACGTAFTAFLDLLADYVMNPVMMKLAKPLFNPIIEYTAELMVDTTELYEDATDLSKIAMVPYDIILIFLDIILITIGVIRLELLAAVHFFYSFYQLYQTIRSLFGASLIWFRYLRSFTKFSFVLSLEYISALCQIWVEV